MHRALPVRRTCANLAAMDRPLTRRHALRLLAGLPLLAPGSGAAWAAKIGEFATIVWRGPAPELPSFELDDFELVATPAVASG